MSYKIGTFSLNDAFSHCAISFEIMMAQFGLLIKIKSYYNSYEWKDIIKDDNPNREIPSRSINVSYI